MVTVDCPGCEAPLALERFEALHCPDCRVEVEIDPEPVAELALAA